MRIQPEQFQPCFLDGMQAVEGVTKGQVVPIDGKKLRRSGFWMWPLMKITAASARSTARRILPGYPTSP